MALKGYVAKKGSNAIIDRVGWLPAKIGHIVPIPGKPEPRSKVLLTAAALLMAGSRCGAWRKPDNPSHRCVAALDREAERPPPEATVTAKRPIGGATPIVRFVKRGRRLLARGALMTGWTNGLDWSDSARAKGSNPRISAPDRKFAYRPSCSHCVWPVRRALSVEYRQRTCRFERRRGTTASSQGPSPSSAPRRRRGADELKFQCSRQGRAHLPRRSRDSELYSRSCYVLEESGQRADCRSPCR